METYRLEEIGCICFRVPYNDLKEIIKTHNCKNASDVQKHCKAGRGCGMCISYIDSYCKANNETINTR